MSKKVFFIPLIASFLFFVVYLLLAQTGNFLSVEPDIALMMFRAGVRESVEDTFANQVMPSLI